MCMRKSSIFPNILHKKLFAPLLKTDANFIAQTYYTCQSNVLVFNKNNLFFLNFVLTDTNKLTYNSDHTE